MMSRCRSLIPEITSSWVWVSRRIEKVGSSSAILASPADILASSSRALGSHGAGHHRGWELDRQDLELGDRGVAADVADRVGDVQVVELGHRDDVAGDGLGHLLLLLALKHVDVPGLGGLAAPQVHERGVGRDPAARGFGGSSSCP